ncbi:MAG: hypothetical protein HY900_36805 [Deltaproteobacteria bacterium]|nr:hypothetical protein [Deltaproteobacteria bacterium]
MKKHLLVSAAMLLSFGTVVLPVPAEAGVDVDVHIGVPPPPPPPPPPVPVFVVPEPETLILIPGTRLYFAPGLSVDLLFVDGYWWTEREGRWFRARQPRGPWTFVDRRRVPRQVIVLPPDYREVYRKEKHIPYGQWKKSHGKASKKDGHGKGKGHGKKEKHGKGHD